MKAIKGLEDRLYALDQMIASCGRLVNEQKELAQVRTSGLHQKGFVICLMNVLYVLNQFDTYIVFRLPL